MKTKGQDTYATELYRISDDEIEDGEEDLEESQEEEEIVENEDNLPEEVSGEVHLTYIRLN
jgi:hypothetical protein